MIDRRMLLGVAGGALMADVARSEVQPLIPLPGEVRAPDFTLSDLGGATHRLSEYRGRPLLVNFWAVWCPPCRREIGALADLRRRVGDANIVVLALNLGDAPERITAFLDQHPAPGLPVLLDPDKTTSGPWHVRSLPLAYAADRDGILRLGAIGERDWTAQVIEEQLRAL